MLKHLVKLCLTPSSSPLFLCIVWLICTVLYKEWRKNDPCLLGAYSLNTDLRKTVEGGKAYCYTVSPQHPWVFYSRNPYRCQNPWITKHNGCGSGAVFSGQEMPCTASLCLRMPPQEVSERHTLFSQKPEVTPAGGDFWGPERQHVGLRNPPKSSLKVLPVTSRRLGGSLQHRFRICGESNPQAQSPWIKRAHLHVTFSGTKTSPRMDIA